MPVIGYIYLLYSGFGEPDRTITSFKVGPTPQRSSLQPLSKTPERGLHQHLIRAGISVSTPVTLMCAIVGL